MKTDVKEIKWELIQLASQLLAKHNLIGWSFRFNRRRRAFGLCDYRNKTIEISEYLIECGETLEGMKGTLIHEIAHALTEGDGHGRKWRSKMVELGQNPSRARKAKGAKPNFKWFRKCNSCDLKIGYHRKPKISRASCPKCSPTFNEKYILEIVRGN
jgi:hypothetical protein